jgi:hypothetical protein
MLRPQVANQLVARYRRLLGRRQQRKQCEPPTVSRTPSHGRAVGLNLCAAKQPK